MSKRYYVYIMTNKKRGVLYIGVTSNPKKRIYEHKMGLIEGFTKRYHLTKLVYMEDTDELQAALQRERTLKHWLREWKITLIEKMNPEWHDLGESVDPRVKPEDDNILRGETL